MSGTSFGFSIEEGTQEDHDYFDDTSSETSSDDDFGMFDEYDDEDEDEDDLPFLSNISNNNSNVLRGSMNFNQEDNFTSNQQNLEFPVWETGETINKTNREKLNSTIDVLGKFLDLKNPYLVQSVSSFLSHQVPFQVFLNFVSRVPLEKLGNNTKNEEEEKEKEKSNLKKPFEFYTPRELDLELADYASKLDETENVNEKEKENEQEKGNEKDKTEEEIKMEKEKETIAIRRSYKVTVLLSKNTTPTTRLLETHFNTICKQVFETLKPYSKGSFFHFESIFDVLLAFDPLKMYETMIENSLELFHYFTHYTYNQCVSNCLIKLISCTIPEKELETDFYKLKVTLFKALGSNEFHFIKGLFYQVKNSQVPRRQKFENKEFKLPQPEQLK
ncbi:heat shock protein [Anaeramoeba flamelloides]|uniref:Heat shock protein n=1 Tax=Anaeramoeba flamelloides TaxID=1746091 RepID=A0ABQ8Y221_9EUKA|nr:heat shock protein [Anaeramoeba flamelloides]